MLVVFFKQTVKWRLNEDRHERLALKWWVSQFHKLSVLYLINLNYWLAYIESLHSKAKTSFLQFQIQSLKWQGFKPLQNQILDGHFN